jgi:hypothetical protein
LIILLVFAIKEEDLQFNDQGRNCIEKKELISISATSLIWCHKPIPETIQKTVSW